MEKFTKICEDIKKELASIKTKAKDAHGEAWSAARDAYRAKADDATMDTLRKAVENAVAAMERENERNENHKIAAEILRDNAKQAFFNDYIDTIIEVWNSREGKVCGEKTAEKILNEIKEKTGFYVSVGNGVCGVKIRAYLDCGCPVRDVEIGLKSCKDTKYAVDRENRILPLDREDLCVLCCGEYVEDIPRHIREIRKLHKKAVAAYEAAQNAISEYNKMTRGNINRQNAHDGVVKYII